MHAYIHIWEHTQWAHGPDAEGPARRVQAPASTYRLAGRLQTLLDCAHGCAKTLTTRAQLQTANAAPAHPPPRPTRKHQRPQNRQATSLLGSADPSRRPSRKASPRRKHGSSFGAGPRKRDPGPPPKSPRDTRRSRGAPSRSATTSFQMMGRFDMTQFRCPTSSSSGYRRV